MNDLKFAFRQLLKQPGITAIAVLSLAVGIYFEFGTWDLGSCLTPDDRPMTNL